MASLTALTLAGVLLAGGACRRPATQGLLTGLFIYAGEGLLSRSLDMNLLPVRSLGRGSGAALKPYSRLRRGAGCASPG